MQFPIDNECLMFYLAIYKKITLEGEILIYNATISNGYNIEH